MKELDFINIIKKTIPNSLIGDDCAYLKDFGIVVTQDNFIEDVHFKREWSSPYQIGYKATVVNISDILASGAKPEYITVGLSLPSYIQSDFIEEFYKGVKAGLNGAKLAGGDITGADKIFVSITAIGSAKNRNLSSRGNAKAGYKVIVSGNFGTSAAGYNNLSTNRDIDNEFIKAHLEPELDIEFSEQISANCKQDYAMMDSSDGLADALYEIAQDSNVTIKINSKKIPHDGKINDLNTILFGAEDYNLVAAVPSEFLKYIKNYTVIGEVCEKIPDAKFIVDNKEYKNYYELNIYDHFGE